MNLKERISMLAPVVLAWPLCELVNAAVRLLPQPGAQWRGGRKRLLIVRLDAIGDFILFLDAFKEYRRLHPSSEWEITLLGNQSWSGLAERLPYADRYLFLEPRRLLLNPLYRLRALRDIRNGGFDRVVEPSYSRSFLAGDAVVRASSAPERIGSAGNLSNMTGWQKRRSDGWYTRLIPASPAGMHELDRNAEFLRGLGLEGFTASPPNYPRGLLADSRGPGATDVPAPYFVLFPGAGLEGKRWPADRFAEIARRLYRATGWTPVLCGGPKDVPVGRKVAEHAPELSWEFRAGATTLLQMMVLLTGASMLIANDTGVVHMAAAVECPTVCIMGGGQFGRFTPSGGRTRLVARQMDCFGCEWWCRYPTVRCISAISLDDVWNAVRSLRQELPR